MAEKEPAKQLLHLVLGGELTQLGGSEFKDVNTVEVAGLYPNWRRRLCRVESEGTADRRQRADTILHRSPAPPARSRRHSCAGALMSGGR